MTTTTIISATTTIRSNFTGGGFTPIAKVYTELDYTFFALGGFYFLLVVFPCVQLCRLHTQSRMPFSKWSTQKLFLSLLFLVNTGRCLFFLLTPFFVDGTFDIYNLRAPALWILNDACSLVFLSTFAALVLFWAEIIHQGVHHEPARYMRITFIVINVLVYLMNISLMVFMVFVGNSISDDHNAGRPTDLSKIDMYHLIERIDNYFFCGLYVLTCTAFLYFGTKLYTLLRGRQAKLNEVALVTSVCSVSFLLRIAMLILVFMPNWKPLHVGVNWAFILAYYIGAEVLPALLVLFILRKLPPSYKATVGAMPRGSSSSSINTARLPSTYTSVSKPIIN